MHIVESLPSRTGIVLVLFLVLWGTTTGSAAPSFPDIRDDQWAHDAVATLAAKGLIEGYADGTFKGDRAMSRWEMAVLVGRLMARFEADHALLASKEDREMVAALVSKVRDKLDTVGMRAVGLEDRLADLDRRVTELERFRVEGDVVSRFNHGYVYNTGKGGTTWGADVGTVNGLNFYRGHKLGTIDLLNGRPFINGEGLSTRARVGIKMNLSEDVRAGLRLAGYSSVGSPYVDSYWGVPAPYLSNPFAADARSTPQGLNNQPWTRLSFDKFVMEHVPSGTHVTVGSVEDTRMDNFVLQRVPNPNIHGKSMARFQERVALDRTKAEVVTLRYYEDEETYLPFFGAQVSGKTRLLGDTTWEGMFSKLPFGANPTAGVGQPAPNSSSLPYLYSGCVAWNLGGRGAFKVNYLSVRDSVDSDGLLPNNGNYFFWTDPASVAGKAAVDQPMRGNTFISRQSQWTYGASLHYRFDPSCVRVVAEYAGSQYQPNANASYSANGTFWRMGAGWTDPSNTWRIDAEYLSTNPYYDPYQLYFMPLGNLALGGVPPGTPLAFAVVPLYYGGFPGSYVPFGYQLHDSGLYPNNRDGVRFSTEYRFPEGRGKIELRGARLVQNQPTTPQRDITGFIHGMRPGFIDTVFEPLNTNGLTVFETPRGVQSSLGGGVTYRFGKKLEVRAQYDDFRFSRSTTFDPATLTAKRNCVNLSYNVFQFGIDYPLTAKMLLHVGYNMVGMRGYHPALNAATYNPYTNSFMGANAGTTLVNVTQHAPFIGFNYDLSKSLQWNVEGRYIINSDHLTDSLSPESFAGPQVMSEVKLKF